LSTTKFESVVIDLSNFTEKKPSDRVYLSHLPTWSLLFDVQQVMITTQINRALINLELHTRLHRPIFCFVAALLGFSCILVGSHTKFGLEKQISLAIVTVIFIKIIESYTTKIAVSTHLLWPVIYIPSLIGILTNLLLLKTSSAKLKVNWRIIK
jgi:lipopolysaccharide export system permease protein